MRCPRDGSKLKKIGISYVCQRCSYKIIQPEKKIYPELNRTILVPEGISWDDFTLTDCSESGGVISLDTGKTEGTIVSPQMANLNRNEDTEMWHDITKILFRRLTGDKKDGRVRIHASNDGATTWLRVKDDGQEWNLQYGQEGDFGGKAQSKYDDLRIKFTLYRTNISDTSPTITNFTIEHNYVQESRKTKERQNLNEILLGG